MRFGLPGASESGRGPEAESAPSLRLVVSTANRATGGFQPRVGTAEGGLGSEVSVLMGGLSGDARVDREGRGRARTGEEGRKPGTDLAAVRAGLQTQRRSSSQEWKNVPGA